MESSARILNDEDQEFYVMMPYVPLRRLPREKDRSVGRQRYWSVFVISVMARTL